ncbi:hypothetical protein LUZ60_018355 [Juncus effusus]|nr:hypothetical protein LUZ60_018355 [Juncus effusus]
MILSVLSSFALVSGLMVVRAKNPVHSVLFFHPSLLQHFWFTYFVRSRFLRYDLPSSLYRSYCRFIPLRGYDVQYSNSGDSRRSIALFTSQWYYWTDLWWEMFFILDNESIPLLPTQRNTTSLRYMVYAEKVQSWTNLETLGNLLLYLLFRLVFGS